MANIVICDDEPHITRAVEIKLRKAGHSITVCENGAVGLEAARGSRPDLVITDCQMPVMTGLELCSAIHNDPALAGIPTVMLTAKGYEINEPELRRQLGVRRLVHKPFSPRDLVGIVDEILAAEAASSAAPPEPATREGAGAST